jgi:hypothetical protein
MRKETVFRVEPAFGVTGSVLISGPTVLRVLSVFGGEMVFSTFITTETQRTQRMH